jgi:Fe-S oxidoreductase
MHFSNSVSWQILFGALMAASLAAFAWTLTRYVKRIIKGRRDPLIPHPERKLLDLRAWTNFIIFWLFQKKVADRPGRGYEGRVHSSLHHLLIFWGFLVITVGTLEYLVMGLWPAFSYERFIGLYPALAFKYLLDGMNALVILVMLYSNYRRIFVKPRLIPMNLDAGLILGMITLLCVTHFMAHGAHWAAAEKAGSPVTATVLVQGFGALYQGASMSYLHYHAASAYWIHVLIVLFFLNYIPYSKHVHLLGALPNVLFRHEGQRGVMPKRQLEEDEATGAEPDWGVSRFEQFTWKSILDTYACTECARCSNYCPANATEKPLSPMKLIHDIRYQSKDRGDLMSALEKAKASKDEDEVKRLEKALEELKPLVAEGAEADSSLGYLGTEALWSCTTCGACEEVCPVFIEHPMKILEMRTNLVLEQESMPQELANAFKGMERNANPWGIGADKRMDWADEDTPILDEDSPVEFEYLLFVGCAGSYDNRCQKQTHALLKVMRAAGVKVAVAPEEVCCGDPARRAGNEFLFQMMAEQNVETFTGYKVKKIVTFCPHCYHTLKAEYPQFGGNFEVLHHSELISDLLSDGRLKLENGEKKTITFHDSCYLGRWNQIYDAPRQILAALPGKTFVELERHGRTSFCCGAGGGRFWMEEESPRVNENRAKEIARVLPASGGIVALGCPFCTTMITDGLKALDRDEDIKVLDLGELVAAALPASAPSEEAEAE